MMLELSPQVLFGPGSQKKKNKKKTTQETKMKTFHLELKENLKS